MENIKETSHYGLAMAIRPFIVSNPPSEIDLVIEDVAKSIRSHTRKETEPLITELIRCRETFVNLKLEGREWAQSKIERIDAVIKKATE